MATAHHIGVPETSEEVVLDIVYLLVVAAVFTVIALVAKGVQKL